MAQQRKGAAGNRSSEAEIITRGEDQEEVDKEDTSWCVMLTLRISGVW